jgi:hypothetical protein
MKELIKFLNKNKLKKIKQKIIHHPKNREEKVEYKNRRMNRLLERFDDEILALKASNPVGKKIRLDGKYEQKERKVKNFALYDMDELGLCLDEWRNAYTMFCNKTENIYGSTVDRSHLLQYSREFCRGASLGNEGSKAET